MSIVIALVSYLIGAIPFAYLLVRYRTGKDIRSEGSGNVGVLNSYEVTASKSIGIIVLVLDLLKGYGAVMLARWITGNDFFSAGLAGVFVVLGHNFNIFLRGKGGRGLAPAAGVSLAINPITLIFWCLMWLTGYYVIRRNVHVGNVSGTIGAALLLATAPTQIVRALMQLPCEPLMQHTILMMFICMQIFIRHLDPMRELMAEWNNEPDIE
ncbi:MAG: glycerol-3-phosphate acyltransferase [Candidatus Kapaibacterium sp.]